MKLDTQEVKQQYLLIQEGIHKTQEVQANLYRMMSLIQEKCSHPILEVQKWAYIPAGQVYGTCGCCGAMVWHHDYKTSEQKKLQLRYSFK